jgi:FlgN protein.
MRFLADAEPTLNLANDILDVLIEQQQALQDLTSLTVQVRDALIDCDVATLEGLAGRQERLTRYLTELDDSRQELMEKWFARDEWELKGRQDEDEGARLLATCEDVQEQIIALQIANAVNHRLLAGIARWMKELLKAFADLFEEAAPYDRHGLRPVQLEGNLLVDHRV